MGLVHLLDENLKVCLRSAPDDDLGHLDEAWLGGWTVPVVPRGPTTIGTHQVDGAIGALNPERRHDDRRPWSILNDEGVVDVNP